VEIRRKYIKPYYCINPSAFKLTQLLSVQNIKEVNNLGKYLYVAGGYDATKPEGIVFKGDCIVTKNSTATPHSPQVPS
jgi:hypothetical protein